MVSGKTTSARKRQAWKGALSKFRLAPEDRQSSGGMGRGTLNPAKINRKKANGGGTGGIGNNLGFQPWGGARSGGPITKQ